MNIYIFLYKCARSIHYSWYNVVLVALAGIVSGVCNAILLIIIGSLLSRPNQSSLGLLLGFIALCLLLPASGFVSTVMSNRLAASISLDLRLQFCRRILSIPLRALEEVGHHRIQATLNQDIPTIVRALQLIPSLGMQLAIVIGCMVYMALLSWTLFLGVLCMVVFGIISYQIPTRMAVRYYDRARKQWDTLFRHFDTLSKGAKELKLHRRRREAFLYNELQASAEAIRLSEQQGVNLGAGATSWGSILSFLTIGLILFVAPYLNVFDLRLLIGYTLVILYMLGPLNAILNMVPIVGRAKAAMLKVDELGISLASYPRELDSKVELDSDLFLDSLELSGVTHIYRDESEDRDFTLGPIDLSFRRGELVFITGGNGSGKTTLAKLLTGLYVQESGEIRLNGQLICDENRDFYRQHFSVVFTDFHLFQKLLGLPPTELDRKAREYLLRLQLDHKVEIKDGILSTIDLSQGQRKRLALMTAYLEDRSIYVFDEWAADQDPVFSKIFYLKLLPEMKAMGKTVFVISHDDRYYHIADRIIKLEHGKIESDQLIRPCALPSSKMPVAL